MEVLQSNTADNIYFWIEDKEQGNVNPIYESHGAYEIYIVCNGERRMYLGNVLYKVGTGDALMISASTPHRSFGDGASELRTEQFILSKFCRIPYETRTN